MTASVLITGASAGIGAAIARAAATAGYHVGINYRSDADGAATVRHAVEQAGQRAVLLPADVTDPDAVSKAFDTHEAAFGPPTAVINNAGIVPPRSRTLAQATPDEIARVIAVNTTGALLVAREAARRMTSGTILNISSVAARGGSAGEYVDYAASKGAVDTMTIGLAKELAPRGIRVLGIRPGVIETEIHAKGGRPDRAAEMADTIPMGRPGLPDEIAAVAIFLISPGASYMTGTTIDVSGGR
ncbi:SDR family oxidoreductase [Pontivivens ytuae]|uniref:SDR family oxidoreductase n=1 Tax=Pontivivens ytuae TaxID=2789856 RepID=A0A7S9LTG8_9RHOB|nr:SDR family oxidoreductase [Pontivivens ytuae]QPH54984.1 SDR family oxidoreductase [Pontivivens ytuae]